MACGWYKTALADDAPAALAIDIAGVAGGGARGRSLVPGLLAAVVVILIHRNCLNCGKTAAPANVLNTALTMACRILKNRTLIPLMTQC